MNTQRRHFFHTCARLTVVAGAALFAIRQEQKRLALENDPACLRLDPCADCSKYQACTLPKANEARSSPLRSSSATTRPS